MRFEPFVLDRENKNPRRDRAHNQAGCFGDRSETLCQTNWTSEYLTNDRLDKYTAASQSIPAPAER